MDVLKGGRSRLLVEWVWGWVVYCFFFLLFFFAVFASEWGRGFYEK